MKHTTSPNRMKRIAHGFTLVELLLAMALMGMFTVITTTIFASVVSVQNESLGMSAVTQDSRYLIAKLSWDISQATAITTPALGGTGSQLVMTVNGSTYTYQLNGGNLQLTTGATSDNLNGSETTIPSFSFQRLGNSGGKDTIRFSFTIKSKAITGAGPQQLSFTATAGRRS